MHIEIYDPEVVKEDILRLKLEKYCNGVRIVAVDIDGNKRNAGNICEITPDGYLITFDGVNSELGLQLDSDERIKVRES